ncbi:MAG: CoA-binding protein [Crocinitomicaceae bacterium]
MKQKVLVFGASLNPARYSHIAINMLKDYEHEVYGFGLREGEVRGVKIQKTLPEMENLDTITLYMGPQNQQPFYDYLINSGAKRVIFNPGTVNPELMEKLKEKGIETENACTLVMLRSQQFDLQ